MESISKDNLNSLYKWYYKANNDPFNDEEPIWAPYDIAVNQVIEENYAKKNLVFDTQIGNNIYTINLHENFQFLKNNPFKQRFIKRGSRNDNIRVFRKNRFGGVIDSSAYNNNLPIIKQTVIYKLE